MKQQKVRKEKEKEIQRQWCPLGTVDVTHALGAAIGSKMRNETASREKEKEIQRQWCPLSTVDVTYTLGAAAARSTNKRPAGTETHAAALLMQISMKAQQRISSSARMHLQLRYTYSLHKGAHVRTPMQSAPLLSCNSAEHRNT